MTFAEAFNWMKVGKKVMCGGFLGYWYWDAEIQEIIIVTRENERIRFAETDNWDFTLGFVNSGVWHFYTGPDDPRESEAYQAAFGTA